MNELRSRQMLVRFFVRFAAYPVALSLLIAGVAIAPGMPMPLPWLVALVAAGLAAVAFLERLLPYDLGWQQRDADLPADIVHAIVNLTVMHATVLAFVWMRSGFGWQGIGWPDGWTYLVQVFAAGVPLDLSLYVMHRLSHRHGLLWRLHSIHHSSNRLYWLNGERRHPLHLAFQHAWTTGWARSSPSWAAQNFTAGTTENASRKRR
ncbi:MAG: sterol desaturase family protein [Methylibium sp.]